MAPTAIPATLESLTSRILSRESAWSKPPERLPPGLKPVSPERIDFRTDEQIIEGLQTRQPITSQKNVWAFWHTGWNKMRPWTQRNVVAWVRKLGPEWTVHVLDDVPGSETNVGQYVEDTWFPTAFNNGTMDGPHVGPHQGDLIRLPLLWKYGGVWMDVGLLLFMHLDDICWKRIEDPLCDYELAGFIMEFRGHDDEYTMLNGFIACKSGNPFVKRWHDIFLALWGPETTNTIGFHKHPLLRHIPPMEPPLDKLNFPDMGIPPEVASDYLAHFLCFERLKRLADPDDGFDGDAYWTEKMLLIPSMKEMWGFQQLTRWSGTRQLELLSARRDGSTFPGEGEEDDDETTRAAEAFVLDALTNQATMKLSHGPGGAKNGVFLADLLDSEEFKDADHAEGTFAAYLRYGSVHFDQTREMVPTQLKKHATLTMRVLEPKAESN